MDLETLNIMMLSDDPYYCDNPPGFDRLLAANRIVSIKGEIERKMGYNFDLFWTVQEITYFAELTLKSPFQEGVYIFIQFSYFGDLFTTFSEPESPNTPNDFFDSIIQICRSNQFIYIKNEDLNNNYIGGNPNFIGGTWRNRFFGTWDEI